MSDPHTPSDPDSDGGSIVVPIPGGFGRQKPGWFQRLSEGLGKSSTRLAEQVTSVLTRKRLDQDDLDHLEEMLIEADIGAAAAGRIAAAFGRARFDKEASETEVKDAIEALPESFRMCVLLADVEGFAYKEIAEMLDIPIGTVMSRLHRGRKALQRTLYAFAVERGLTGRTPAAADA